MKYCHLAASVTAAILLVQSAAVRAEDPQPGSATKQPIIIKTDQDWRRVRASASSAEEFRALAKWCDQHARLYRKKAADSEAQLQRPYPRNSARDQILKNTAERYNKQVRHWDDLAEFYMAKSDSITVASGRK